MAGAAVFTIAAAPFSLDIRLYAANVRLWPKADMGSCTAPAAFGGEADIFGNSAGLRSGG
jgi:hypothetical protein